jgi:phospholipase/carboxylesterase
VSESLAGHVYRFEPGAPGAPTLLLLHGTGGNEDDLLPLGRALARDAALLSPRGRVLEHGMPRFFRRISEGVFDEDDVRRRAGELAAFVAAATERHTLDPRRVIAAGFSNGANIACAVLLLHPGVLSAAILLRAMVPLVPDPLPKLGGAPVFLSSGRADPLVNVLEAERLASLLERAGADVSFRLDDGGHTLGPAEVRAAHDWLAGLPQSA